MLFQRPPICGMSGSGSQPGQYTAALMVFASFRQPAGWAHVGATCATAADDVAGADERPELPHPVAASASPPMSATAAKALTPPW